MRTLRCSVLPLSQGGGRLRATHEGETSLKAGKDQRVLFSDDVDEAEEEESGEEIEHPVSSECSSGAAGKELKQRVTGEAEAEAVGDGPGKWDGGDGEERGDADLRISPLDGAEAGEHEAADEDESGRGGEAGDGSDERGYEEGEEK